MYSISALYKFTPLEAHRLAELQKQLQTLGDERKLCGLLLIAEEGVNGTIAGDEMPMKMFEDTMIELFGPIVFKRSQSINKPFKRYKVKVREEIVTIGDPHMHPDSDQHRHISAEEWHRVLDEEDVIVIDARNAYETAIGTFKGAVDPKLKTFQDFPGYVREANIPKTKKVLLYCTGGIRCEKAKLAMEKEGYTNVYQLQGGILKYLEEFPEGHFRGECFVFDHRVAVDQHLQPSQKYHLCPHCGDPGNEHISCVRCNEKAVICVACKDKEKVSCSKDCANRMWKVEDRI